MKSFLASIPTATLLAAGAVNAHDVGVGARVGGVGAMKTGASIDGRLFAPTAVTLQKNNIAVP
jgi:hypothetical protein